MFEPAKSPANRQPVASRPPTSRSAVANRTRLHCGVDGRSAAARRFRDLVRDFAASLGGFENLSEADATLVREAAAKTIEAEALQAALARGETLDTEQSVRVSNVLARLLGQLERRRAALKPKPASRLVEHFGRPPAREAG